MGSMGVGLGQTTPTSSIPHSRTAHSSTTRARTKPATQASGIDMNMNGEETTELTDMEGDKEKGKTCIESVAKFKPWKL